MTLAVLVALLFVCVSTALVEGEMTAKRPELLSVRPMNASTHPVSINPSIDAGKPVDENHSS